MLRVRSFLPVLLALLVLCACGLSAAAQKDPLGGNRKTLGEELAHNPKLVAKLKPLLPEGMDIDAAAKGFKKAEDFATALHVAQNLKIAFSLVKAKMISGEKTDKAIHELDPTVDAKAEAKKAENQAKEDMKG